MIKFSSWLTQMSLLLGGIFGSLYGGFTDQPFWLIYILTSGCLLAGFNIPFLGESMAADAKEGIERNMVRFVLPLWYPLGGYWIAWGIAWVIHQMNG